MGGADSQELSFRGSQMHMGGVPLDYLIIGWPLGTSGALQFPQTQLHQANTGLLSPWSLTVLWFGVLSLLPGQQCHVCACLNALICL